MTAHLFFENDVIKVEVLSEMKLILVSVNDNTKSAYFSPDKLREIADFAEKVFEDNERCNS